MILLLRLLILFVSASLFVFFLPITEAQSFPDKITGQVINRSENASSVEGSKVFLYGKDLEEEFLIQEQLVARDGSFQFNDLHISPLTRYFVSVEFLGVFYVEEVVNSDGSFPKEMLINVYETTSNEDVIDALSVSILFSDVIKDSNQISVMEIVLLNNTSKQTYIPGDRPMDLIRFGLPGDVVNLDVDSNIVGYDFIQVDKGFALVANIPPGIHEVAYTYFLNYEDAELSFAHSLRYGAGILRVLINESDGKIISEKYNKPQLTDIGGQSYLVIESKEIVKGEDVSLRLYNLPQNSYLEEFFSKFQGFRYEFFPVSILLLLLLGFLAIGSFNSGRRKIND